LNILITGGCGFIGSNLAFYLKNFFKVSILDNLSRRGSEINFKNLKRSEGEGGSGVKIYIQDITNIKSLNRLPKYDLIIDCCAEPSVEASKENLNKIFNINLVGTLNLLNKCVADKSKIIFLSTSRVYSIIDLKKLKKPKIINQKYSTEGPKSIYGFTKLASEDLIKEFSYLFKIKYLINRCGVVSGPGQFGKTDQGFVSLWVWKHINKFPLLYKGYNGSGRQVRDVLHINDLCELIYLQIKKISKINNQTFLIGGGKNNSVNLIKLTEICRKITGNFCKVVKNYKISNYDIPFFICDNKKIYKFYKWRVKNNIQSIVQDIFDWQLKNYKLLTKVLNLK
jgi:CDP-paratose 2-epimerase